MKRFGILALALMFMVSIPNNAEAKRKKSGTVTKTFGNTVKKGVTTGVSKNVQKGFYGKSSLEESNEEVKEVKKEVEEEPVSLTTKTYSKNTNPELIQRNQTIENHLAEGVLQLNMQNFQMAVQEFEKARTISDSPITRRWLKFAQNTKILSDLGLNVEKKQ